MIDQTVIHNPWEAAVAIAGIAAFAWTFVTVIKTARR